MTHAIWQDADPQVQRAKREGYRLQGVAMQLRAAQLRFPHIADTLQAKIDDLEQRSASYLNPYRTCICGLEHSAHVGPDLKCPFEAPTFRSS